MSSLFYPAIVSSFSFFSLSLFFFSFSVSLSFSLVSRVSAIHSTANFRKITFTRIRHDSLKSNQWIVSLILIISVLILNLISLNSFNGIFIIGNKCIFIVFIDILLTQFKRTKSAIFCNRNNNNKYKAYNIARKNRNINFLTDVLLEMRLEICIKKKIRK